MGDPLPIVPPRLVEKKDSTMYLTQSKLSPPENIVKSKTEEVPQLKRPLLENEFTKVVHLHHQNSPDPVTNMV